MKKKKLKTTGQLKKILDRVFSIFIRQRDNGKCFTCPEQKHWKQMQAGHYVSRSHHSLRWDERNVNCQCMPCNIWKKGNMDVYALRLQLKHGDQILNELQKQKHEIKQFNRPELEELIKKYANASSLPHM